MLPEALIARLRERAADPKTRSDASQSVREALDNLALPGPKPTRVSMSDAAGGGAFGGLMQLVAGALASGRGFNPQKMAERVAEDVRAGKTSMAEMFGDVRPGVGIEIHEDDAPPDGSRDLPAPATPEDVAAAEAALAVALPADLKQIYTDVANGGFGPSTGFLPLDEVAALYREFRSEPQGPCDKTWPENLLPVVSVDMGEACYDLDTGRIICWDQEELVDEESEDEAWNRSFVPWADSLADWLETWLAEMPLSERVAERFERSRLEIVRNALAFFRDMTPEERAEMGLPDQGWEEQVCRNHGVDPEKVL